MGKGYSIDLRKKVIALIEKGNNKKETAKVFGIGFKTVYRWIELHNKGNLGPKKRTVFPMKVDLAKLEKYVKQNNDHTLTEIAEAMNLGKKTVWTWLRRLNITRKKRPRCTPNVTKKVELNSEKSSPQ